MTKFWAKKTGNWWLSNFYPAEIIYNGKPYPTSEHLYQALKCDNKKHHEEVRNAAGPKASKVLSRVLSPELKPLKDRINFMRTAIGLKYGQHEELKERLLELRGIIVEDSPYDDLWGVGPDGDGVNLMGILLMELREKYISEFSFENIFT